MAKPNFEKRKQEQGDVKAGGNSERVLLFMQEVEKKVEEGFYEQAARNSIVAERYEKFGKLIKNGAVSKTEIKSEKGKEEQSKSDVLFYNSPEALDIQAIKGEGLTSEEIKRLQERRGPSFESVGPIKADENDKAAIMELYMKSVSDKERNDKKFIKELEKRAERLAELAKVLKMLYERVEDKLADLENSPDRDEKLQEILSADPKFGADLFWIAEINEHLRNEEARCVKETAAPRRFAEANGGIEKIIGHGMGGSLAIFVGRVFKIAWQSAFLKGQKADKKVQHFFKEITEESLELFGKEVYYGGALVGKAGRAGVAGVGKVAKLVNRQSIENDIKKAEKLRDKASETLKEASNG